MARGQLPKAYLRMDPNIDQVHPDWQAFVQAMLVANRQPARGRFRELDVLARILGEDRLAALQARGDLIQLEDGRWLLEGWDLWQEGDLEVGERMRRVRAKRAGGAETVTRPSLVTDESREGDAVGVTQPSPPSEASRRLGVQGTNTPPTPPSLARGGESSPGNGHGRPLPSGRELQGLVETAAQILVERGVPADRQARRRLKGCFRAGETLAAVERAIAAGQFDYRPPL
jgi:hypothetical protein